MPKPFDRPPPPPWLPNWRDAAGYPDPDAPPGTSARWRWRWEFLRRFREYQSNWIEKADHPAEFWRERYGLRKPVDPASPHASFVSPVRYWIQPLEKGDRRLSITQREGTALVRFDLTLPLEPQLEWAEFTLRAWTVDESDLKDPQVEAGFLVISNRRKGYQWKPSHWLRYLRLLDADAIGTPIGEIGRILHPGLKNERGVRALSYALRNDRRAARALRDGGYRLIM